MTPAQDDNHTYLILLNSQIKEIGFLFFVCLFYNLPVDGEIQ